MKFLPRSAAIATVLTCPFQTTFAFFSVAFLAFTFGIPDSMGAVGGVEHVVIWDGTTTQ